MGPRRRMGQVDLVCEFSGALTSPTVRKPQQCAICAGRPVQYRDEVEQAARASSPPSTLAAQMEAEECSKLRTDLAGIHSMGIVSIGSEKTRLSLVRCQDKSQNSVLK